MNRRNFLKALSAPFVITTAGVLMPVKVFAPTVRELLVLGDVQGGIPFYRIWTVPYGIGKTRITLDILEKTGYIPFYINAEGQGLISHEAIEQRNRRVQRPV